MESSLEHLFLYSIMFCRGVAIFSSVVLVFQIPNWGIFSFSITFVQTDRYEFGFNLLYVDIQFPSIPNGVITEIRKEKKT